MSCCSTCSTGRCALRFRLHGTELVRHAGYDMTGKMVDDLPNHANRDTLLGRCRSLIETREPVAVIRERLLGKRVFGYGAVWLPLGDDGKHHLHPDGRRRLSRVARGTIAGVDAGDDGLIRGVPLATREHCKNKPLAVRATPRSRGCLRWIWPKCSCDGTLEAPSSRSVAQQR
jgi:hypothetical protein